MLKIYWSSTKGSIKVIRAKYVFVQDDRLYAVYDTNVKPSALRKAALQLAALPGVEARATRAAIPEPTSPDTTVLWMRVLPAFNANKAQKLFQQLTKPELAIAIARVEMRFGLCRCGKTSITVSGPIFLPEFNPEDVESFDLRLDAALQQLDVWTLVNEQPRPPYTPLSDALDKLLAELGAYATNLYIKPVYDPELPCLHDSY
jgi:hypothetical protein